MYDSLIDRLIDLAIEEDIATGDITTNAIIPVHAKAVAEMKAKADGVISGLEIAKQEFERFEKDIVWEPLVTDGTAVKKGDIILRIEASYRTLLCGERLSLNILQRMSGIATATSHYMKEHIPNYWTPGKQLPACGYWTKWPYTTEEVPITGWDFTT